jgi:hypothetical protein
MRGYTVVGYSTIGTYEEHTNHITRAYEMLEEFKEWANMVEIVDDTNGEVFERWERE